MITISKFMSTKITLHTTQPMKYFTFLVLSFFLAVTTKGQSVPKVFQPGIISKGDYESHPAFSPTMDTLYFIKLSNDLKISAICVSYLKHGQWSTPQIAAFSGKYMDADPFVSKDGHTLYFMSNRPEKEGDPVKDNTDIWKVSLTGPGSRLPVHLAAPVNSTADEYYPTLADNGDLYFGSTRNEGNLGGSDIYRCRLVNGVYQQAENLGNAINSTGNEFEAFIAPDQSYLIFNSTPGSLGRLDFYISYQKDGTWTKAIKLPEPFNSDGIEWAPKVSRNGKLFYFSSTRNNNDKLPLKAESIQLLNKRLETAGNSLGDLYTVDFDQLLNTVK